MRYLLLLLLLCISFVSRSQHIDRDLVGTPEKKLPVDTNVFTSVEIEPRLYGKTNWKQYVKANIQYPTEVKSGKLKGDVLVSMLVETDGTLKNIRIAKGLNVSCNQEAIRLVKGSPKWRPGISNNRPVRSLYTVAVSFVLHEGIAPLQPLAFHTIPGMLSDKNGAPLSGWSIMAYGTNDGNLTYPDGHFSLDVPNQPVMLSIAFHATPRIFVIVKPTDSTLNVRIDEATERLAKQTYAEWLANSELNLKHIQNVYGSNEYHRYMGWFPKDVSDESILADMPSNIAQQSLPHDKIYTTPSVQPKLLTTSFDWNSFVARTMVYPKEAREQHLRGKVFVGFIISKDGSVSDVTILKGLRGDCNEAAMKVVRLSKWQSGLVDGTTVRCFHSVIVDFNR